MDKYCHNNHTVKLFKNTLLQAKEGEKTNSLVNVWLVQTKFLSYWSLNFTMHYIINVHAIWLARQSQILNPPAVVVFFPRRNTTSPQTNGTNPLAHTSTCNFPVSLSASSRYNMGKFTHFHALIFS